MIGGSIEPLTLDEQIRVESKREGVRSSPSVTGIAGTRAWMSEK
jgi:hypothetical protein